MPHYVRLGRVPRKRHVQFRRPDGGLYAEEVFGTKGFSGIASILYHAHPPTGCVDFRELEAPPADPEPEQPLRHQHFRTARLPSGGDPVTGRVTLLANPDVSLGFCRPTEPMDYFYKNAEADELLFIHEGSGRLETIFGTLAYGPGDYLVIPRGTIYRMVADPLPSAGYPVAGRGGREDQLPPELGGRGGSDRGGSRLLVIESAGAIEPPRRYRNEYGQLLEHSPYSERDIRTPEELPEHAETGRFEVRIRARGKLTAYFFNHHPLDVVGWDGYLYPWALNIRDFEPITGSIHQPPPVHQTFQGHNFVVCSFVPRMLDYHPEAVPVPYNHSNVESDEVLYYVNGNFGSRRGIEEGSITLHPLGLPHGPQPGIVEASLGAKRTEELAVMLDTFRPLRRTRAALAIDDPDYPRSWAPEA